MDLIDEHNFEAGSATLASECLAPIETDGLNDPPRRNTMGCGVN